MKNTLVGRKRESEILRATLTSPEPEMVAVVGRRRVGKTFLIKKILADQMCFEATGVQNATAKEQIQGFAFRINLTFYGGKAKLKPKNWLEAFQMLILALEEKKSEQKKVIFLDELPWFDSRKSGFLRALSFFWNSWCVNQPIVLVICGSAASWMIENVVNDRGGLHNRITKRIDLQPFTLYETEQYLLSRKVRLERYQLLILYMVMGGIPHYLKEVTAGKSAIENVGDILFTPGSTLENEYQNLYPSLFENAAMHHTIIEALANKWIGLSRKAIVETTELSDGSAVTKTIQELLFSGFISAYTPFGKVKREVIYRLTDEYSLFYLHFIASNQKLGSSWWQSLSQTATFKSWCGYAFENLCLRHLPQIKKALGISGIYAEASSFAYRGSKEQKGFQIDLVLDRRDQTMHLFEFKFYTGIMPFDTSDANALRDRRETFRSLTKTKKHIFVSYLTTYGVRRNENSIGLIDHNFEADVLFEE